MDQKPRPTEQRTDKGPSNKAMAQAIDSFAAERGIKTVQALADATGLTAATISRFRNNTTLIDFVQLTQIARAFNIKVADLTTRAESIEGHFGPMGGHLIGPPSEQP
jgi:transcriptional regulator with XRE-family HTH domain